jgi:hypothetical protein
MHSGIPHFTLIPADNPNALKKTLMMLSIRASLVKKSELNAITQKYLQLDQQRKDAYDAKVKGHACSASPAAPQLLLSAHQSEEAKHSMNKDIHDTKEITMADDGNEETE